MLKTLLLILLLALPLSLAAQTNAPATNAPSTNAPAATPPASIALGDVVALAQSATTKLQEDQTSLDPDPVLQNISTQLPDLKNQIDDRNTQDEQMLKATASLSALQASQAAWQSLSDSLKSAQNDLSRRVSDLDKLLWDLDQRDTLWKTTLDTAAKQANTPPEITQRIQDVRTLIGDTLKMVQAHQTPLYLMQNRVAAEDKLVQSGLDTIRKATDTARAQLFERNRPPLWDPAALAHPATGVMSQERASLGTQIDGLRTYLAPKAGAMIVQFILFLLLIGGFYWTRNQVEARAKTEPSLQHAAIVFSVPVATALLFALLATWFLYPDAPRMLWAIAGATALLPAVVITRRLIDSANFPILYATVIAYFVDQIRYVVTPSGIFTRFLFITELLAAGIFILTALRSKHLTAEICETQRLKRLTRLYLHLTFFVLVFAGYANVFGYTQLSVTTGNGMLESSYLAVIFYAAVRVLDALAICAMSIPPLSGLGMVRRHLDLIYAHTTSVIRWAVFALWLVAALKLFTLYDPVWQRGSDLLGKTHKWGSLEFQFGSIVAFPLTIWASFLISRFIRFTLSEELYPHLQLGRGIPYATSTVVHYAILLVGFFIAVKAGGADLTQFSFLVGAFGVGLGFGLQNIMNNFISGIILLFERPIKVGDDIQIDATTLGRVERIGIRASVILLTNGAELIVPNGNLISNPVTNWTLSNCERLIEIPVNVTSKVDPQHVLDLLLQLAKANPAVLKNPAPQALLATVGATLAFKLRVWIDSEDKWMRITSDLSLAVHSALAAENVTLG